MIHIVMCWYHSEFSLSCTLFTMYWLCGYIQVLFWKERNKNTLNRWNWLVSSIALVKETKKKHWFIWGIELGNISFWRNKLFHMDYWSGLMDDPIVKQKAHSFDFCSLLESYKVVCFLCTLKQETSETSHVHSKHE